MIIHESLIELNMQSKYKAEIIETLAQKAKSLGRICDVARFTQAVFAREVLFPTAIGYGIAIPHGKCSDVEVPFIAFARSQEEFVWDSRSEHGVKLIFLIGVPEEQASDLHLKILANISRGLMNDSYRERLEQAGDVCEVMRIFEEMGL
ncbi:PTS sugar transporter subunit IIA [Pelosinus fermentans]|uniref:Putative PTS IIA-like nitrogen-regulatory protein PtsN n=1 Tax=Pelosinus fermentans JBW45 TaxID=1192197 RepID=I8U005_9FIRM|nr:fructose PTS transporter subunit IIA [Pelosinus fermentans]AJQ29349.1 putative PTS IIA-like nitrogen-regulatory protein PtsN [Pelosinus fermentans JBW45]